MGGVDGRTPNGDIIGAGPVDSFATPPKVLAADPCRRFLFRQEWIGEFFKSTSSPARHGFSAADAASVFACYSFVPGSNLPIKVIVFDDTERDDDPYFHSLAHGSLDQPRYDWLISELDEGQAEGKLTIIAAHFPIGVDYGVTSIFMNWSFYAVLSEPKLIAQAACLPKSYFWIAGQRHDNTVTAFKSPDENRIACLEFAFQRNRRF